MRQRARSVRIAISVWASQKMPLVWWRIAAPVSSSRRLVHLERVLVEADRLGDAVVGADDRRVPAGVARRDVVGLEDGDVRDPVAGREVVRGRQAVAAAADDDDVVARLRRSSPADREQACRCTRSSAPEAPGELVRRRPRRSAGARRRRRGATAWPGRPRSSPGRGPVARSATATPMCGSTSAERRARRRRTRPRPRRSRASSSTSTAVGAEREGLVGRESQDGDLVAGASVARVQRPPGRPRRAARAAAQARARWPSGS